MQAVNFAFEKRTVDGVCSKHNYTEQTDRGFGLSWEPLFQPRWMTEWSRLAHKNKDQMVKKITSSYFFKNQFKF